MRFQEGKLPVIKVGEDKTIFKTYAMNHSSWELDKMKQLTKETDGKGNMKLDLVCEIPGLGGNEITKEQWKSLGRRDQTRTSMRI